MDTVKVIALVLIVVGGLLQIGALVFAVRTAKGSFAEVERRVKVLRDTMSEYKNSDLSTSTSQKAAAALMEAKRKAESVESDTIWDDIPFMKTWILHAVASGEFKSAKVAAWAFGVGIALATGGGVLSLF